MIHGHASGRDRLEILDALISSPSFDPLYRDDIIKIPGGHPIYRWECVVGTCERPRTGGPDLGDTTGALVLAVRGSDGTFLTNRDAPGETRRTRSVDRAGDRHYVLCAS